ncbi:MAG: hypothetical protein U5N85_05540 [Arcicella sp.]|nr:hypothetical protein [Arcicella sp.]
MKEIKIITTDNFEIIANHFSPEKSNSKVIVINAATGIKQGFYFKYATFLNSKWVRLVVITYD